MSLIPRYYSATTNKILEKSLERGYVKYPAICFIHSTNTLAYIDINNQINYVQGNNQITDIQYIGNDLVFYCGDKILFSYNVAMSPDDVDAIIQEIKSGIKLDEYTKATDVANLLDDIIGDLSDKATVVDYINSLSYNTLSDTPIINLVGTLSNIINISTLEDGVYKIKGQYVVGGNYTTIQSSSNDVFFIVSHDADSHISITQLQGKSIRIFFINPDGSYTSDRYLTEKWIAEQDFITSANVKEYVREIVTDTVVSIIDETLDSRLDIALDNKIDGINSDDIKKLFQKGE